MPEHHDKNSNSISFWHAAWKGILRSVENPGRSCHALLNIKTSICSRKQHGISRTLQACLSLVSSKPQPKSGLLTDGHSRWLPAPVKRACRLDLAWHANKSCVGGLTKTSPPQIYAQLSSTPPESDRTRTHTSHSHQDPNAPRRSLNKPPEHGTRSGCLQCIAAIPLCWRSSMRSSSDPKW